MNDYPKRGFQTGIIADLIARLTERHATWMTAIETMREANYYLIRELTAAIATMTQEIEKANKFAVELRADLTQQQQRAEAAETRVLNLQAAYESAEAHVERHEARVRELEIEVNSIALEDVGRDRAIETKTIERCAQVADQCKDKDRITVGDKDILLAGQALTANAIATAIRALQSHG